MKKDRVDQLLRKLIAEQAEDIEDAEQQERCRSSGAEYMWANEPYGSMKQEQRDGSEEDK